LLIGLLQQFFVGVVAVAVFAIRPKALPHIRYFGVILTGLSPFKDKNGCDVAPT
jgi:hypothetical protein